MAKLRLANDHSPFVFVEGIKKAALNHYCEDLKTITSELVNKSTIKAIEKLKEIDPYDFDLMVFVASDKEGVWEIESLLRIYQIFHADEILESFFSPDTLAKIRQAVVAARKISLIEVDQVAYDFPQVRPIRKKELYQSASLLSFTPVEIGDIFKLESSSKLFILIGQDCDLIVRNNGERNSNYVNLIEIKIQKKKDFDKWKAKHQDRAMMYWRTHAELHNFSDDVSEIAIVNFAASHLISVDILDLAVLNNNGICQLDITKDLDIPTHLTTGWQVRLKYLCEQFTALHKTLSVYKEHLLDDEWKSSIWKALMPKVALSDIGLPELPYNEGNFDFGISRIARYRKPGAERLLKAYTAYLSRDADNIDFSKFLENPNN